MFEIYISQQPSNIPLPDEVPAVVWRAPSDDFYWQSISNGMEQEIGQGILSPEATHVAEFPPSLDINVNIADNVSLWIGSGGLCQFRTGKLGVCTARHTFDYAIRNNSDLSEITTVGLEMPLKFNKSHIRVLENNIFGTAPFLADSNSLDEIVFLEITDIDTIEVLKQAGFDIPTLGLSTQEYIDIKLKQTPIYISTSREGDIPAVLEFVDGVPVITPQDKLCLGDSGSGLRLRLNGRQIGVLSSVVIAEDNMCGSYGYPTIMVDTTNKVVADAGYSKELVDNRYSFEETVNLGNMQSSLQNINIPIGYAQSFGEDNWLKSSNSLSISSNGSLAFFWLSSDGGLNADAVINGISGESFNLPDFMPVAEYRISLQTIGPKTYIVFSSIYTEIDFPFKIDIDLFGKMILTPVTRN